MSNFILDNILDACIFCDLDRKGFNFCVGFARFRLALDSDSISLKKFLFISGWLTATICIHDWLWLACFCEEKRFSEFKGRVHCDLFFLQSSDFWLSILSEWYEEFDQNEFVLITKTGRRSGNLIFYN